MTILIFGKDGQVGRALQDQINLGSRFCRPKEMIIFLGRKEGDLSNLEELQEILMRHQPRIIINTAAYTSVDKAEVESDLAFIINAKVPELMAQHISKQKDGLFIHFSTDYVFGDTQEEPYREDVTPGPENKLNIYGRSKLAGERLIINCFEKKVTNSSYFVIRTSWVYGDGKNFIKTIFKLAQEKESLDVVFDQVGVPTSAIFLARLTQELLTHHMKKPKNDYSGIYHVVPNGVTSWYSLAQFIVIFMKQLAVSTKLKVENVRPISSAEYKLPAVRPSNSRLNTEKIRNLLSKVGIDIEITSWQEYLEDYLLSLCKEKVKL